MFPKIKDWLLVAIAFVMLASPAFVAGMEDPIEVHDIVINN